MSMCAIAPGALCLRVVALPAPEWSRPLRSSRPPWRAAPPPGADPALQMFARHTILGFQPIPPPARAEAPAAPPPNAPADTVGATAAADAPQTVQPMTCTNGGDSRLLPIVAGEGGSN